MSIFQLALTARYSYGALDLYNELLELSKQNDWREFTEDDPELQPAMPYVEHQSKYGWVLVWHDDAAVIACRMFTDAESDEWIWVTESNDTIHNIKYWKPLPVGPNE